MNSDQFNASSIPQPRKLLFTLSFLKKLHRQKATLSNGTPSLLVPWKARPCFRTDELLVVRGSGQLGRVGSDVQVLSQKSPRGHGQVMEAVQESRDEVPSQSMSLGDWH